MRTLIYLLLLMFPLACEATSDLRLGNTRFINGNELSKGTDVNAVISLFNEDAAATWEQTDEEYLSFGYTQASYWLYWPVINHSNTSAIFRINNPTLEDVTVWLVDEHQNVLSRHAGGAFTPSNERLIPDSAFSYTLNPNVTAVLARIQSSKSFYLQTSLTSREAFSAHRFIEANILGAFVGIMVVMIMYNCYLATENELRFMGQYCAWITLVFLHISTNSGHIAQYFGFLSPTLLNQMALISGLVMPFFSLWFTRDILDLKQHFHKAADFAYLLFMAATLLLSFVVPTLNLNHPMQLTFTLMLANMLLGLILMGWRAVAGDYRAFWLFISFATISVPGAIKLFMRLGMIDGSYLIDMSVFVCAASETLLVALLIASMLQKARKDELASKQLSIRAKNHANNEVLTNIDKKNYTLNSIKRKTLVNRFINANNGLPNHDYFMAKATQLIKDADQNYELWAVVTVEISHTHKQNSFNTPLESAIDLAGAKLIKQHFKRNSEIVSTYANNGFSILIKNVSVQSVTDSCKALQSLFSSKGVLINGTSHPLNCAISVEMFNNKRTTTIAPLFRNAYQSLMATKQKGPNALDISL